MNAVSGIINILSNTEKEEFIGYLKKKNKRHDTKNIQLFSLLKTDDIKKEIVAKENKQALYALRKRLYQNLIEFIGNKRFESDTSEERVIVRLIIVCRVFFEHKLWRPNKNHENFLKIYKSSDKY